MINGNLKELILQKKLTGMLLISMLILCSCVESKKYHSFKPGELWLDDKDIHINVHGGGIL